MIARVRLSDDGRGRKKIQLPPWFVRQPEFPFPSKAQLKITSYRDKLIIEQF